MEEAENPGSAVERSPDESVLPTVAPSDVTSASEHRDWFLARLVFFANQGSSFPITLSVGGVLVSGMLVGGAEYFKRFGADFRSMASAEEDKDLLEKWAAGHGDRYRVRDLEADEPPDPDYIHLAEARYYIPGQRPIPTSGVLLWRGRISQVDGFTFGSFVVPE